MILPTPDLDRGGALPCAFRRGIRRKTEGAGKGGAIIANW